MLAIGGLVATLTFEDPDGVRFRCVGLGVVVVGVWTVFTTPETLEVILIGGVNSVFGDDWRDEKDSPPAFVRERRREDSGVGGWEAEVCGLAETLADGERLAVGRAGRAGETARVLFWRTDLEGDADRADMKR